MHKSRTLISRLLNRVLRAWYGIACLSALLVPLVLVVKCACSDDTLSAALAIEQTFEEVIARAESGVVSIARRDLRADSEPRLPLRAFGGRGGPESLGLNDVPEFFGTGVVIARNDQSDKRYVLTNDHVLRGGRPDAPLSDSKLSPNLAFDVYLVQSAAD